MAYPAHFLRGVRFCGLLGIIFLASRPVSAQRYLFSTLFSFNGDGYYANGALTADSQGNLYGTTPGGGAYSFGSLFKYAPATGPHTVLASFNNANGANPNGGLLSDGQGHLY